MWSPCRPTPTQITLCIGLLATLAGTSCRPGTERKDTPYQAAAEKFGYSYCDLAFTEGCSVPDDCGVPAGFDDAFDCEFRLVPFLRSCSVPDDKADEIIAVLESCQAAVDAATCDEPLCGGGVLDTPPCTEVFEALSAYCRFEGL